MRWIRESAFVHGRKKGSRGMRKRLERGKKEKVGVCKRKEKRRNGDVNRKQDKSDSFN